MNALEIRGLTVTVPGGRRVVDGLSLRVPAGAIVALAGRSGSGKSLTARSVVRLHGPRVRVTGSVLLGDGDRTVDAMRLGARELRRIRGRRVGYAFQDAAAALNPVITIGRHLTETVRAHGGTGARGTGARGTGARGQGARGPGAAALERCGLDPARVWDARPYELSGGQIQRAALALATVLDPDLLVADEVTTALDPVTQAAVLDTLRAEAAANGRAVLLITHDLAVAGRWADEIAVLAEGRVVEQGPSGEVLAAPQHPFTRELVEAARRDAPFAAGAPGPGREVVRAAHGTRRVLRGRGRTTLALDGAGLDVRAGESVAVVGRSGSGKSTLAGVLAGLDRPDAGTVLAGGRDVWEMSERDRRAVRRAAGLVFQDALASFDPRYTVERVVAEALDGSAGAADRAARVAAVLDRVGLDPSLAARRPATLSGGERQRVALARALASGPELLLADEPTTGLDVLARERILGLLAELRREEGLAVVFVTHDLRAARRVADRVVVLAGGRVAEELPASALGSAGHPETRTLWAATPAAGG
ncbi:ABC transporter ATP-binding protein [Actinomadura viridis]|uniref:ABC transporter ATP-binding protein n=1 Tax=Actinomadura viridis TaxID=58110 RepID=UPI0036A70541